MVLVGSKLNRLNAAVQYRASRTVPRSRELLSSSVRPSFRTHLPFPGLQSSFCALLCSATVTVMQMTIRITWTNGVFPRSVRPLAASHSLVSQQGGREGGREGVTVPLSIRTGVGSFALDFSYLSAILLREIKLSASDRQNHDHPLVVGWPHRPHTRHPPPR